MSLFWINNFLRIDRTIHEILLTLKSFIFVTLKIVDSSKYLHNVYSVHSNYHLRIEKAKFVQRWRYRNAKYVNIQCELVMNLEKVYFRSQILEHSSIGEYLNISGVPVLPETVIFTFFRTWWHYSEDYNTGMQKWSSIVQYSCTSIWDLKYTFSVHILQ